MAIITAFHVLLVLLPAITAVGLTVIKFAIMYVKLRLKVGRITQFFSVLGNTSDQLIVFRSYFSWIPVKQPKKWAVICKKIIFVLIKNGTFWGAKLTVSETSSYKKLNYSIFFLIPSKRYHDRKFRFWVLQFESWHFTMDLFLCSAKVHAGFTDANLKNTEQSTWLDVSINADFIWTIAAWYNKRNLLFHLSSLGIFFFFL